MNTKNNTTPDPQALMNVMLSLQRLIKIGIYYPSGHSVLDRATEEFCTSMHKVAGDAPHLCFCIRENELYVQNTKMDMTHNFTREFTDILASLSIQQLDIAQNAHVNDIHEFLKMLLSYKTKMHASRSFSTIDIDNLPPSITMRQTEFLSTESTTPFVASEDDSAPPPTLETFLDSLSRKGLSDQQIDKCRHFLREVADLEPEIHDRKLPLPQVSWQEVETLFLRAATHDGGEVAVAGRPATKQSIDALGSILKNFEEHPTQSQAQQAINLLVSLAKGQAAPAARDKPAPQPKKSSLQCFPLDVLETFIADNRPSPEAEARLHSTDRCELLAIMLQLLGQRHAPQVHIRIQHILNEIFSTRLMKKEWQTLIQGSCDLMDQVNTKQLAKTWMMSIIPLRTLGSTASPLTFLRDMSRVCSREDRAKLWPFVVNELLVTDINRGPQAYRELYDFALSIPTADIDTARATLENLDACKKGQLCPSLFLLTTKTTYPLLAFLLTTSLKVRIAEQVIQIFRRKPTDWVIQALNPLLNATTPLHQQFLYEYLTHPSPDTPRGQLRNIAGQIILDSLPQASEQAKNDPSLTDTIKALSQFKVTGSRRLLRQIAGTRRMFIFPDWPKPCRKAAREALQRYERHIYTH